MPLVGVSCARHCCTPLLLSIAPLLAQHTLTLATQLLLQSELHGIVQLGQRLVVVGCSVARVCCLTALCACTLTSFHSPDCGLLTSAARSAAIWAWVACTALLAASS